MISRSAKVALFAVLAALLLPSSALAAAALSVSPTSFSLQASQGTNVSSRTVQISSSGNGILKWSVVAPTATWVRVSPTSGTNAGTVRPPLSEPTLHGHGFEATATRIIPRDDLLAISRANLRYTNAGEAKARNGLSV